MELVPTEKFDPIHDPYPESRGFTNVKLYNHLVAHKRKGGKHSFCSIDCMTREFEGRSREASRREMRRRLTRFRRWARDEHEKFIVVPDGGNGALAAKIFDPFAADDRDRELVAGDLNKALHRREITQEAYDKIFHIVYPMLNDNAGEEPPPAT